MIKTYLLNAQQLNNDCLFNEKFNEMSKYRQNKINRFIFRKDKNLSLGAGILLSLGLKEYGLTLSDEILRFGENEKPYINGNVFFSISHSEEYVICSFSDCEVGSDIEKITDIDTDVGKIFFTDHEYALMMNEQTKEERNEMFFRLWTLKESFMKVTGLGMSLPSRSFEISFGEIIQIRQSVSNKDFFFFEYELPKYKISVCSEKDEFEKKITNIIL